MTNSSQKISPSREEPPGKSALRNLFTTSVVSYQHWGVIILVALAFVLVPQLPPPNDWERNTAGLANWFQIYQDPNAVYPPWSIILLWPYRLLTAPGSRIASVLVVGWLTAQQRWTLARFAAIVASPYFLWTMVTSNVDVLALLLPAVLWESAKGRSWQWLGWSVSMLALLIKPQGGALIILLLVWKHRHQVKDLIAPLVAVVLFTVPVSLAGTPPLVLQWLDNAVFDPSSENLRFWSINNVSLTDHLGFLPGIVIVTVAWGGVYLFIRLQRRPWTWNHTLSTGFLIPMLLGPYASSQGMIVPLALVPSWWSLAMQYVFLFIASYLDIFRENSAWFALVLGTSALWLYAPAEKHSSQTRKGTQ